MRTLAVAAAVAMAGLSGPDPQGAVQASGVLRGTTQISYLLPSTRTRGGPPQTVRVRAGAVTALRVRFLSLFQLD